MYKELSTDEQLFQKYLHIPFPIYEFILERIKSKIEKQDTHFRVPITAGARLEATLLFLVTGHSFSRLQYLNRIEKSTLGKIIPEVCDAIYSVLGNEYIKTPTTKEEWQLIAEEFQIRWQFTNCLGALDGKHVAISPPSNSGSYYFNYKGTHSVVLMAVANANYEIVYADVGANGRVSDGGVWANCSLNRVFQNETANIPDPRALPNSNQVLPFVLIGDDAFPLRKNLMKPFPHRQQNNEQRVFSYRLSRARRVVENAFGIMANRFGILRTTINLEPKKVEKIIFAIITLHNLLRKLAPNEYTPGGTFDSENVVTGEMQPESWRSSPASSMLPIASSQARNSSDEAKNIRLQYMNYFNNDGAVTWQLRMAGLD